MADYYNGADQTNGEAGNEYAAQAQSHADQPPAQQAEQAEQKEEGKLIQNSEISNDSKMFVGGLSRSTTTESLRTYFESFGALRDASVKIDTMTFGGFGFILFEDAASVDAVLATPEHVLDGKKIDPKKAVFEAVFEGFFERWNQQEESARDKSICWKDLLQSDSPPLFDLNCQEDEEKEDNGVEEMDTSQLQEVPERQSDRSSKKEEAARADLVSESSGFKNPNALPNLMRPSRREQKAEALLNNTIKTACHSFAKPEKINLTKLFNFQECDEIISALEKMLKLVKIGISVPPPRPPSPSSESETESDSDFEEKKEKDTGIGSREEESSDVMLMMKKMMLL